MKTPKLASAITIVGAVIVTLLSLVLLAIDGLALFSNIAALYENGAAQSMRYLSRCLCMLLMIAHPVLAIIAIKKGGALVTTSMLLGFGCAIISVLTFVFYEWYIAVGLVVGNLLLLLPQAIALTKKRVVVASPKD